MKQYIVAFDLGSYKISGAIAEVKGVEFVDIIALTMTRTRGIKAPYIRDINMVAEDLKTCKNKLEVLTSVKCIDAYVSIPVGICEYIEFEEEMYLEEGKLVDKTVLDRLLEKAKNFNIPSSKHLVDIMALSYSVDGYDNIIDPIGMGGSKIAAKIKLVVVSDKIINPIEKVFELNEINIKGFVVSSLAEYYLTDGYKNNNKYDAIVNVGGSSVNISILNRGNILYSEFIPFGEDSITNDLMQCLKINEEEAVNLKMNYNILSETKNDDEELILNNTSRASFNVKKSLIVDIIEARIDELIDMIKQCLEFSGLYEEIDNIVFSGSGFSIYDNILKNVSELCKKNVTKIDGTCYNKKNRDFSVVLGIVNKISDDMKNIDKQIDLSIEDEYDDYYDDEEINVFVKIKNLIKQFF